MDDTGQYNPVDQQMDFLYDDEAFWNSYVSIQLPGVFESSHWFYLARHILTSHDLLGSDGHGQFYVVEPVVAEILL
jgi:hypothetical protein